MQHRIAPMKRTWWLGLLLAGGLLAVVLLVNFRNPMQLPTTTLRVGGHTITLEVARTLQEQEQGLGGRMALPANRGMLFVFSGKPGMRCIWMKDMHFPLDILWLDSGRRVIHIEQNVSPATYPATYCPPQPTAYVIELNARAAAGSGIQTGQVLDFQS